MVMSFSGFWNSLSVYAEDTSSSILISDADKLIQLTPPSIYSGGNSLTVKGRIVFYNPGSSDPEPIRCARVDVKDKDWEFDETVASGLTDDDGYFYFDGIDNDDGWLQDGRDIYVEVFAENWAVDVVDNPGWVELGLGEKTYHANNKDDTREDVSDHSIIDFGTLTPDHRGAYNILNTVLTGWRFLRAQTGISAPQVKVFFKDWFTPSRSFYYGGILPDQPLFIRGLHIQDDNQDQWNEDVILHEYGHFIMDKYADFWTPFSDLYHDYSTSSGRYPLETAWLEGWAHFFSAAARHWAGYPPSEYSDNPQIEDPPNNGDNVEGAIAGVLWDIYDAFNSSEPEDTLELGFDAIWDVLTNYDPMPGYGDDTLAILEYPITELNGWTIGPGITLPGNENVWPIGKDHPWDIYDFWDGWYASWWWEWHGFRYSLWDIFELHGIDVPPDTTPPSNPEIWSSSHNPYVWSADNTVDVRWEPATDDISGAGDYLVIWDNSPSTVPELNALGTTLVIDTNATSPPLAVGDNWWFHVRTRDNAGNWATGATHHGPFYIETTISASINPTTIAQGIEGTVIDPTTPTIVKGYEVPIIGSTTLPAGSVITLKIAGGWRYDPWQRTTEYEPWDDLIPLDVRILSATVGSQGQFTVPFYPDQSGIFTLIALFYDGSGYWHSSKPFQFYVQSQWIRAEAIPDTVYLGQPVNVFGSTNLPPNSTVQLGYWPEDGPSFDTWTSRVVIDSDGNFTDIFKPPFPWTWTEGNWVVGIYQSLMTYYYDLDYFQVVPLPPPTISITPSNATLQPTLGSCVNYTITIHNDGPTDTFFLSLVPPHESHLNREGWTKLNFQYQPGLTVASGQTLTTTLTVTTEGDPVLLGDYEFNVSARYTSWPRSTNTAQATLRVDFTPTLPAVPTGGLAITIQPKITYLPTGTFGWLRNITVSNNQNFDDAITVEITNSGVPIQDQADLNWFNFPRWTARVYIPTGQTVKIPLLIDAPASTANGKYIFRAVAASTADFAITAEDSGTIMIGDTTPPNITEVSQIPLKNNVLPEDEVEVNSTVTDDLSGVKRVTLNCTNGNGTWIIVDMTNIEGNIWNGAIPNFPYSTNLTYVIKAEDNENNTITTEDMGYEHQYRVIPEFPSFLILPLFVFSALIVGAI